MIRKMADCPELIPRALSLTLMTMENTNQATLSPADCDCSVCTQIRPSAPISEPAQEVVAREDSVIEDPMVEIERQAIEAEDAANAIPDLCEPGCVKDDLAESFTISTVLNANVVQFRKQIDACATLSKQQVREKLMTILSGMMMSCSPMMFYQVVTSCSAAMTFVEIKSGDLAKAIRDAYKSIWGSGSGRFGDLSDPGHLAWYAVLAFHPARKDGCAKKISTLISEIETDKTIPEVYRLLAIMSFRGSMKPSSADLYNRDYAEYVIIWDACVRSLASQNTGTEMLVLAHVARIAIHYRNMPLLSAIIASDKADALQLCRYLDLHDPLFPAARTEDKE